MSTDVAVFPVKKIIKYRLQMLPSSQLKKILSTDVAIFPVKNKKICLQMLPSSQLKNKMCLPLLPSSVRSQQSTGADG